MKRTGRPKGSRNNPNRPRLPFRQSEVMRGIRAVKAQGLVVRGVEIDPHSGLIKISTSTESAPSGAPNPWDAVLSDSKRAS